MIPGSNQIHLLATKYSKPQLQQMAQMGEISPLDAVMAGMMIDRIVLSANKPPESTVADDVFTPKTQMAGVAPGNAVPGNGAQEAPGGAQQEIAARMHMPQLAQAPQSAAAISAAHGGLMSIPRPGEKYNQDNFATGGIVAFSKGDRVKEEYETRYPTDEELAAFQAEAEQARGANTRPMFEQQNYRMNQGPSGGLPQIMDSPEAAVAPAVAAPAFTNVAENQKQLAKVKPAAGPLAAMVQKEEPEMGLQQIMQQLPKRTPADTTGLVDTPETIAKNKDDLMYRAVGYTGAEMMAGKSPFALVNIGEALSKGFSAYAQQIEAHKKTTKEDIKDLAAIKRAEAALDQGYYKISADILQNELTNKRALEVAEKQIKKDLDVARIGAESRRLDKNITPFEVYANPNSTPEQKSAALEFASIGKDKREFSEEQKLNREKLWYETVQYQPEFKGLSAAKLEAARQQWLGGGGGGKGEVNKSNPLLTGK